MAEYPYYDGITGRMKGNKKEIEKAVKRLAFLTKAEWNESDDGEEYQL